MAFLADTSVWRREHQEFVSDRLLALAAADELWTCWAVDLEMAYNARGTYVGDTVARRRLMQEAPITRGVMEQSLDLAGRMAEAGLHRHAKPMDLVIASAAMASELTVLHYHRDFDHIASVTGQATEWVSPPGSLD